jgi:alpha-glucosidase (family GH31 glycosyl hydrolase)
VELNVTLPDAFEELCQRWQQLGLVLPLAFNHYAPGTIPRNPTDLQNAFYLKVAMRQRYRLLPYYYSVAIEAAMNNFPIVRPMFFEFPDDPDTFELDQQFMIGSGLLAVPALEPGQTTVNSYFPKGTWVDFYNGNVLSADVGKGQWGKIPVTGLQSPLVMRGGDVVFSQVPTIGSKY